MGHPLVAKLHTNASRNAAAGVATEGRALSSTLTIGYTNTSVECYANFIMAL